jgi:anti-sigma factor RsiW
VNCRQSSRLLSEALDRELTRDERRLIEEHLEICPACTRCRLQFETLRTAARRFAAAE